MRVTQAGHVPRLRRGRWQQLSIEIAVNVWQRAFVVQMKGFYHQRSGIKLGPLYSDFVRPRDHHPADGIHVRQSTFSELGDSGVKSLAAGKTDVLVPEAWGEYHDAGDWNPSRSAKPEGTERKIPLRGNVQRVGG